MNQFFKHISSGELAEMVIYQGPIFENQMFLGATGFWNSTLRPQVFYVTQRFDNFDFTRAEILGGIDGKLEFAQSTCKKIPLNLYVTFF